MKNFQKIVRGLLAIIIATTSVFMPFEALVLANENITQSERLTEAELDILWDKMSDENYSDYEFDLTDAERDALWQRLIGDAETYVENLSEEKIIEIEAELEAFYEAEEYFLENLSPEFLWELYVEENPEVLRMRNGIETVIEEEINTMYETLAAEHHGVIEVSPFFSPGGNTPVGFWTRRFSQDDGVSQGNIAAIEAEGLVARTMAERERRSSGWSEMREDAFRHWLWNHLSVRATTVGLNATTRYNRTRIVTTNRELATAIFQAQPSLETASPTANQLAMGRYLRIVLVNLTQVGWRNMMNTPSGRDVQMDLWNNYWGRRDGANFGPMNNALRQFNDRWNSTAVNTGLVRGTGTGATAMSIARQDRIWTRRKALPHN